MRTFLLLFALLSVRIQAATVLVAAASDLQFVFPELIAQYETAHPGTKISPTYGSSGKFYEQIRKGAPFDLYLSADAEFPKKLIASGHGDEAGFFQYGIGKIVVWALKTSSLEVEKKGIGVTMDSSVQKIAIANPDHAPYGRAAVAALQKAGVYESVKDRFVLGENVVQAAQFVETGAAEVGVIGLSLALAPQLQARGKYSEISADLYPKLEQAGLVISKSRNADEARKFKAFLQSDSSRVILTKFGFSLPETH